MELTTRVFHPAIELRETDGKPAKIVGLAVPYDQPSDDLGGFREVFAAGAFDDSIATGDDVRFDIEHNRSMRLARSKKGTGRVESRSDGVWVEITMPNTSLGRDALEEVRNGNLDGMSIGFVGPVDEWGKADDGTILRTIRKAELRAVTLTSMPAYSQTVDTLALRSLAEFQQELRGTPPHVLRRRAEVAIAEMGLTRK